MLFKGGLLVSYKSGLLLRLSLRAIPTDTGDFIEKYAIPMILSLGILEFGRCTIIMGDTPKFIIVILISEFILLRPLNIL